MDLDDHSQPEKAKEDLYNFYRRRANQLRYQKTRVLQRWAHNAFVWILNLPFSLQKNVIRWFKK